MPGGVVDLSIGTPYDPPPPVGRRGARLVGRRARLPAVGRHRPRSGRRRPAGSTAGSASPSTRSTSRPAWARRSSWPACPTGCACGRPSATRCCTRAISYPSYAMGATLAGCRAVPYATLADVDPDDAARALCLWVNSPANPTGDLDDLAAAAAWGRAHGVPCCRTSATSSSPGPGPGRTIVADGLDGVRRRPLAVQALEPRRGPGRVLRRRPRPRALPVRGAQARRVHGARARCRPRRWPPSATTPTSTSSAAATSAAWPCMVEALAAAGRRRARCPAGAFYLWAPAPGGDAWALAHRLAAEGGAVVAPGRVLRRGRGRPRAHRRRPARRQDRARGAAARRRARRLTRCMPAAGSAVPPPGWPAPLPGPTTPWSGPSGWWFAVAGLVAVLGIVAGGRSSSAAPLGSPTRSRASTVRSCPSSSRSRSPRPADTRSTTSTTGSLSVQRPRRARRPGDRPVRDVTCPSGPYRVGPDLRRQRPPRRRACTRSAPTSPAPTSSRRRCRSAEFGTT